MINDLIRVKDKVEYLLSKYKETRSCDKHLWLAYMVIFHDLKSKIGDEQYKMFKDIFLSKDCCSMESVRRVRQKYQEGGLYLGENRMQRITESDKVREWSR